MTDAQCDLLLKAWASLDAARLLHGAGFSAFSASRAYYAMFYVAQAFLEGDGLAFSRHAGASRRLVSSSLVRGVCLSNSTAISSRLWQYAIKVTMHYARESVPAMRQSKSRARNSF